MTVENATANLHSRPSILNRHGLTPKNPLQTHARLFHLCLTQWGVQDTPLGPGPTRWQRQHEGTSPAGCVTQRPGEVLSGRHARGSRVQPLVCRALPKRPHHQDQARWSTALPGQLPWAMTVTDGKPVTWFLGDDSQGSELMAL